MTGWNMPPGVNVRDIPGNDDSPCGCCGHDPADCICPECPQCEESGNEECYRRGHLEYTKGQLIGQARMRIYMLKDQIADDEAYIRWLEEQPDGPIGHPSGIAIEAVEAAVKFMRQPKYGGGRGRRQTSRAVS